MRSTQRVECLPGLDHLLFPTPCLCTFLTPLFAYDPRQMVCSRSSLPGPVSMGLCTTSHFAQETSPPMPSNLLGCEPTINRSLPHTCPKQWEHIRRNITSEKVSPNMSMKICPWGVSLTSPFNMSPQGWSEECGHDHASKLRTMLAREGPTSAFRSRNPLIRVLASSFPAGDADMVSETVSGFMPRIRPKLGRSR